MDARGDAKPAGPPVLPYTLPSWVTPRRVVLGAMAWGPLASIATNLLSGEVKPIEAVLQLVVAVVVARWVVAARSNGAVLVRSMAGGVPPLLVALWRLLPTLSPLPVLTLVMLTFGFLFQASFTGVWRMLLMNRTQPYRSPGAGHDAVDRALLIAGLWRAPVALYLVAVYLVRLRASLTPWPLGWLTVALEVGVPLAVALVAVSRLGLRRRWVRRVDEGLVPRWRIVPAPDGRRLPPVTTAGPEWTPSRVLVRVEEPEDPYREATREVAVAAVRGRA